jgi:putative ABC transport system permease protein
MLKHSLLMVYRNFLRGKGYFLINLTGLTAGLVCTLLIFLWVRDEFRMNKFHANDERLYQFMEHQQYATNIMTTSSTPGILAENIKLDIPEVEYAVETSWINDHTLSIKDHNVKGKGYSASEDFFNVFSYPLKQGDPSLVLKDKYAIVLSEGLAIRLFGTTEGVVGQTVEIDHDQSFNITGLFSDIGPQSSFVFEFVTSWEYFKEQNTWVNEWGNNGPSAYVVLKAGSDPVAFNDKIKDYIKKKDKEDSNVTLFIQKYSERYLYGRFEEGKQSGGRIEYVRLFSIIAIFILLIACINFMNLATARASRKGKEVGIKKAVGATRGTLIFQYLTESFMMTLLAIGLSCLMVWALMPAFNVVTDKRMVFTMIDGQLLAWLAAVLVFTGLIAGSYPALYLSGFGPAAVLKGMVKGSIGELWARKGLVVLQFFISVFLIVSVLVIYKQILFVQNTDLGYKKDHLIQFPTEGKVYTNMETFLNEVRATPGVVNASTIGHGLLGRNSNTSGLEWEGKNPEDRILFENMGANFQLIETLGIEVLEGRTFSEPSDTTKIIFNEAAIEVMNLENPIGKKIRLWGERDLEIIGVVKNFHFQSLHDKVNPVFFWLNPKNTWNVMVRLEGGHERKTLQALGELYASFNPGFSFEYKFQDDEYARQYAAEQRVAKLSGYFASMAILISCLGLFGLAAFTAERRLKEIGIRKALGSSVGSVVLLLSRDFTWMVLISIVLGLPFSYWLLSEWLTRFAFRIPLEIWYFVFAGVVALVIAWLTVAYQALKAARINPVDCLRTE